MNVHFIRRLRERRPPSFGLIVLGLASWAILAMIVRAALPLAG